MTPDQSQALDNLQQLIDLCMLKDRETIRRKLQTIRRRIRDNKPVDQLLEKALQQANQSAQMLQLRGSRLPSIHYAEELPVSQKRNEIIQAIYDHQVIVICGETGSGKTTQLPKMCIEAGLGTNALIGHTQPRRIAARSVATRIAEELKSQPGEIVGFKVRFTDTSSESSLIKLMTDGILLAEILHDPMLMQYDCIIVDEAHERSLNIDFLLGYLKRLCVKRKDLKLIITSATIDPQRFSKHFDNAPIIEVSGRTYPVTVEYRDTENEEGQPVDMPAAIAGCVDEISRIDRGDILVFLSGERDIREAADYLQKQNYQNTEILPLLARLSASEQNEIFNTSSKRRIILSTNVAETSLTVPGIRYVIDSGLARISRYSWRSKIQRLPIEKISQASANQRKGRCGRVSAGICYRLYSEEDFNLRAEFTEPEIQRTNLAAVILTMEQMKLGHVDDFPFVEPPDPRLIKDGYKLLHELGAIDSKQKITRTGQQLSRLPIDPKLGRILIEATQENCLTEALIIVSALSVQDPRERPMDRQQAADEAHKKFSDTRSDFISWLNLWNHFSQQREALSSSKLRKWCKDNFISWMRMREWQDTHRQIQKMLRDTDYKFNSTDAKYDALHRAILSGFLSNIGFKEEGHEYQSCRQRKFHIFPGSDLFNRGPKWVVASDIVETQKVYARHLARIEPQWISEKAAHLIKHSYTSPHWEKKSSQVSATRKSTLFGLLINPGTKVNYGPINSQESREIFIREALVQGHFDCKHDFFIHNRKLVEQIENLEAKSRRQDILVEEETIYNFYDTNLPDDIYSGPQLNRWVKQNDTSILKLSIDILMQQDADHINADQFPDTLTINSIHFPIEYHFDPSHHCDGITLITPVAGLASLNTQMCDWLVPGMLLEKITELIRSLPKKLRKNFVPAPDFAKACLDALVAGENNLTISLSNHLRKMTGVDIPFDAWQPHQLADYLLLNYRVIDNDGKVLAENRDLNKLQQQFSDYTQVSPVQAESHELEADNVDYHILDNLPECIDINNNGITIKAYPTLTVQNKQVNVRIIHSRDESIELQREGMRQLFINALSQPLRHLKSTLRNIQTLCNRYTPIGSCDELKQQLIYRMIDTLFTRHMPESSATFESLLDQQRGNMDEELNKILKQIDIILATYQRLYRQLKNPPLHWLDAMTDIQDQLNHLLGKFFIVTTSDQAFSDLPRYLMAIEKRLEKIQQNPERDRKARLEIASLWSDYKKRNEQLTKNNQHSAQLEEYRWLLEEYRISLFAQEIKTRVPVSSKRLRKAWLEISDA